MSDKHTPEPWGLEKNTTHMLKRIPIEDARRIVACINACAGISTEDLEKFAHVDICYKKQLEISKLLEQKYRAMGVLCRK